jgi:hypothetical protein
MPITIARFVQTKQWGWANYALFGWNGRRKKELIGCSSYPKAVGSIIRASYNAQLGEMGFIAVRIQRERRDRALNSNAWQDCARAPTNSVLSPKRRWFDKKSKAKLPAVFSIAVIPCSSGVCFYWNK